MVASILFLCYMVLFNPPTENSVTTARSQLVWAGRSQPLICNAMVGMSSRSQHPVGVSGGSFRGVFGLGVALGVPGVAELVWGMFWKSVFAIFLFFFGRPWQAMTGHGRPRVKIAS